MIKPGSKIKTKIKGAILTGRSWQRWSDLEEDGAISAGRSRRRNLDGMISKARSWRHDLEGAILPMQSRRHVWGWGVISSSLSLLSLSRSLSLFARLSPEMVWSENRNVKQFPGQSHNIYSQMKLFSGKFYFPCATKHAVRCKIIS